VAEFPPLGPERQLDGLSSGTLIGGYRVEGRIGAGAMATVFRARDEALGRTVALKVLAGALSADAEFRERFMRESQAASTVDHPNIIPIYAAGEDAGVLYLAMRYVSGGDLHSVIEREGPLPPRRAVSLLSSVASALDAAHRAGIVHRDVKPANVLVDVSPGRADHPYLSDFGLAKREASTTLTNVGEFVGTTGFAAPEQISGDPPRFATDQYALACVAFALLTASMPFRSSHPEAVLWAQMSQPPPRVTPRRPDLPSAVDEVFARALAKEPSARFPTCGEFIDTLDRVLAGEPYAGSLPAADGVADAGSAWSHVPPAPTGVGPGHPSFPPPALEDVRAERAPRQARRSRGFRIAAGAGAAAVIAAAAVAGAILLNGPDHAGSTGTAASPEVSAHLVATLSDPDGMSIASAAFTSGGMLRTVDQDDTADTFAIASQRVTRTTGLGRFGPAGALFSLDGQAIAAPGAGCGSGGPTPCTYEIFFYNVMEWDAKITAGPGSAVATGDFTMAVTTRPGDGVRVWNLRTLAPAADLNDGDHRPLGVIALSPDGGTVAAVSAGTGTHQVYVWNTASPAVPAVLPVPGKLGVASAAVNVAGTPLAVAGSTLAASDGLTTNIYSLDPRHLVTSLPAGMLALSPDGKLVATADPESAGTVDLWNAATGKTVVTLAARGAQNPPSAVAFSADGRFVAIGYNTGTTDVWHLTESQIAGS
jgi:serine/threonine-protein kinase